VEAASTARQPEIAARRDPRSYTPNHLAEKILTTRSALEGERKQVTVLFADVKGSMELAEQVDAEEWHRILDRFFQILADGVHRFEGTINQYTGDGIMALFGAPIAHEDHAQRACYAALQLRDELRRYADELRLSNGLNFSVRMGLNSGEVVVGKIGDDLRMDYTAQGHTVGLAARIQELAAADRVYLTSRTARLVEGFFALRDLGPTRVRGAEESVDVHELEGIGPLRTRFEVSRARGLTRFVGRKDDMGILEGALARIREGNGQVVGVVGEAGVGKSRLCFEFLERCRAQGLMVLEGHAVAHGKNVPFLPMLQIFRAYYGIAEQDSDRVVREKIAGRLLLIDEGFREVLPLLFEFFGVPDPGNPAPRMDPEARQRQLFDILRRILRSGGADDVVVTLVEDLHWMDGGSEAFLEQWVEAIPGARNLLLVNFRPEYHAAWIQKSSYRQLPLLPLGPEATRELLADLLGQDTSVAELAEAIHERTAGNPFFTEEVVQSLIESRQLEGGRGNYRLVVPVATLEVPDSVQSLLAARIDRLAERDKQVLQAAAVIGKEFAKPLLAAVVELPEQDLAAAVAALTSSEFVYEQALYPVTSYAFKHPLTQEVARESQLRERRSRLHAAVAQAIEAANPEKLDEQAALLAHHWDEARDSLAAARWHRRAAEWVGVSHAAEAHHHWSRMRTLLEHVPESAETMELRLVATRALLDLGFRVGISAQEAANLFAEGRELAERCRAPALLARLFQAYAVVKGLAGDVLHYQHYAQEAVQIAEQTGDVLLRLNAEADVILSFYVAGRLHDGLEACHRALGLVPGGTSLTWAPYNFNPYTFVLARRSVFLAEMGHLAEGRRDAERTLHLALQERDYENAAWTLMDQTWLATLAGEQREVLDRARRAFEISEKVGSSFNRMLANNSLSWAFMANEEWQGAVEGAERTLAIIRESGVGKIWEPWPLTCLARAHLGMGEVARARARAEEGITVARRLGTPLYEIDLLVAHANALLRVQGDREREQIEEDLSRAQALVEETGGRVREPSIHESRAELARLLGEHAAHQRELREAHRLFTEMGATGHAERVARELDL
jgi:class 3 adenylate cyclase